MVWQVQHNNVRKGDTETILSDKKYVGMKSVKECKS